VVPVFPEQVSPEGSRNLLAPTEAYLDFNRSVVRSARTILQKHHLKGFYVLRAAYACERYEQITSHQASINGDKYSQIDPHLDQGARLKISY